MLMDGKTFYERVEPLCTERGMSVTALGAAIGISSASVSGWKNDGATPHKATLKKAADYLGVSIAYLRGETEKRSEVMPVAFVINIYGSVPAGIPLEAIEDIVDTEEIPASWTDGGKEYFGLRVKGDSMYPKYFEGDTIILRKQSTCENKTDCVVYVNGYEATLKTVSFGEDGSITLMPVNTNYQPVTYTPQQIEEEPVVIAGVVVELRRSIKG